MPNYPGYGSPKRPKKTAKLEAAKGVLHIRQKRAAAVSAQSLWRKKEETDEDDDEHNVRIERRMSKRHQNVGTVQREPSPIAGWLLYRISSFCRPPI